VTEDVLLRVAASVTVTLEGLGTAGYRWSETIDNPRVVFVAREDAPAARVDAAPGRSRDERFTITGASPGDALVHFALRRPFEPDRAPQATRDVRVRVVP
jgi:predicted secreted protein